MIQHSLLLIYRSFTRFKSSFFINLIGLSIGLASSLLIYLWVNDELLMDRFNEKNEQLYQVLRNEREENSIETEETTPGLLARSLAEEIPEVERAVAVVPPVEVYKGIVSFGDSHFRVMPQFVDKDYFKLFTIDFIQGDKNKVLLNNSSISITKSLALKLFHTTNNVIGKTVKFKNKYFDGLYTVAGVFDTHSHSSVEFDVIFNYNLFLAKRPEVLKWSNGGPSTYLLLKNDAKVLNVNDKITDLLKSKRKETKQTLFIQKYSERYLYGKYENGKPVDGKIIYVRLFSIIAGFILLIACINFMNLSTARASRRLKEVGIKKTIGAGRKILIFQYLSESVLMTFISLIVALLFVFLLLPQFNIITGKDLSINFDFSFILTLLIITLVTGIMAGSYPAFYISSFSPITVLKGKLKTSFTEILIRKWLVTFQFSISVILIILVLVIYKQIQFIQNKNLGYNKENVISFIQEGEIRENFSSFMSQIKNVPGVVNVSYMFGDLTGGASSRSGGLSWNGVSSQNETEFHYLDVDYGFIETLGMKMKSGRPFSKKFGSDSLSIIFNETAIKLMGLKEPIGKKVKFYGDREIVGVVEDFNFESIFEKVKPFFFKIDNETGGNILVKIRPGTERATMNSIEHLYKEYNKEFPFEYKFLDEDYQKQYALENKIAILSRYFAGIAILISCLGLFGLAAFMVERRLKEIGIRKILGASEFSIIYFLSNDFTKAVLISILIAFPISYSLSSNWLDSFAYKIPLEWWYFAIAGALSLTMAWLAVGAQLLIVAKINVTQCLREE